MDPIIKHYLFYNMVAKSGSARKNGLHAGHLAIMVIASYLIPPEDALNTGISTRCAHAQLKKFLGYEVSYAQVRRDLGKLERLGLFRKEKCLKSWVFYYNLD